MRGKRKGEKNKKIIIVGIIITFALLTSLPYYLKLIENHTNKIKPITNFNFTSSNTTYIKLYIPAVDAHGDGVLTLLKVFVTPGEGRTLVDIDQLLFWIDTQQSIQLAKKVAQEITNVDLSKYDIVYTIEEINATIIEGPSAGAALVIATVAAIQGKELRNDVMITGTINPDGSIGQVGGILAKAKAAKEAGAKIFLVPKGQGTQVNYVPKEECEKINYFTFCRITYKREVVNVGEFVGIKIIEVSNIREALKYF
ncbi:MAG: S16 family serine protease [Candidatus Woesearchaeota archaeon]